MRRVPLRPTMTLPEAFEAAVAAAGAATLAADGERVTLSELASRADALAARLRAAGARAGDHVGLLAPNGVGYAEAFFAVVRLGGIVVPLEHELPPRGLEEVARAVPLRATLSDRASPSASAVRIDATRAAGAWDLSGPARPEPPPGPRAGGDAGPPGRGDPGAVFFTSGTTGEPKPVVLTHHQLVRPVIGLQRLHAAFFSGSAPGAVRRLATVSRRHGRRLLGAAGRQTWLTTSPFRSMAGHQVLLGSLLLGHSLVTSRSFHPRRTLELVDEHGVNVLAVTPAVLELLLRVPTSPFDLGSLLVIGVGGGPAAPDLVERARERFGCAVTIGYGSTELGGGVLATRLEDSLPAQAQTVGRPFPGAQVRIVDEHGDEVAAGNTGELVCRPGEAAGEAAGEEPWLRTGDLGTRDADGNIRILGRKDDLVIRGGQNVHPLEVERVVEQLPGVARCAVVGVPRRAEQQLWAFVTATQGQALDRDEIRGHCRAHLPPGKQPDHVRIVEDLPVTEQGEVRRRTLREQAVAER